MKTVEKIGAIFFATVLTATAASAQVAGVLTDAPKMRPRGKKGKQV